jgi:hypothetical protein
MGELEWGREQEQKLDDGKIEQDRRQREDEENGENENENETSQQGNRRQYGKFI